MKKLKSFGGINKQNFYKSKIDSNEKTKNKEIIIQNIFESNNLKFQDNFIMRKFKKYLEIIILEALESGIFKELIENLSLLERKNVDGNTGVKKLINNLDNPFRLFLFDEFKNIKLEEFTPCLNIFNESENFKNNFFIKKLIENINKSKNILKRDLTIDEVKYFINGDQKDLINLMQSFEKPLYSITDQINFKHKLFDGYLYGSDQYEYRTFLLMNKYEGFYDDNINDYNHEDKTRYDFKKIGRDFFSRDMNIDTMIDNFILCTTIDNEISNCNITWNIDKQKKFIEHIFNNPNIPISKNIYFIEESKYIIISGYDIINSIKNYIIGKFSVNGLYYHNLFIREREDVLFRFKINMINVNKKQIQGEITKEKILELEKKILEF